MYPVGGVNRKLKVYRNFQRDITANIWWTVTILEEVNYHATVDFKRLNLVKDINSGHTIYRNRTKGLGMKHMARNWHK